MWSKVITIWVQVRDLYLYIFRHALILNAYVDDHTWYGIRHRNWGDDLNYYFFKQMSGRPIIFYHNFKIAKWLQLENYLCIGTLLDAVNYSNHKTIVWGTGVSGQEREFVHPQSILTVRGSLTEGFLRKYNIQCPNNYGDPALLLPRFYSPPRIEKKYKVGIIPHVLDLNIDFVNEIRKNHKEILIIDLAHYKKWTDVIDQICACKLILSSSLHGLIASDAYGVPNSWIEMSNNVCGGNNFKFLDYFSAVCRKNENPIIVENMRDFEKAVEMTRYWRQPNIDIAPILNSCPFLKK